MPETPPSPPSSAPAEPSSTETRERSLLEEIKEDLARIGGWLARNPVATLALAGIAAVFVYFFWFYHPFVGGSQSVLYWANTAWNPEGNQEHGRIVPFIALFLIWYHREELVKVAGKGSNLGLLWLGIGCLWFLLGVRCLQPRFGLTAIPFLLYGSVMYVAGRQAARVILFPCVFLFFMIPVAALEQATFRLQFIITGAVGFLAKFFGIGIHAMGTALTATDGAFNFEVAEGCSGIRSLAAMTMITAAYVYLTQDRLWKQLLIFACSLLFAIIGNIGRIFTVILVAKYYDPKFAGGLYHDQSGYVFFPIALVAMLLFAKLVNWISPPKKKEESAA